jgi:hypothetical protein
MARKVTMQVGWYRESASSWAPQDHPEEHADVGSVLQRPLGFGQ